MPRLDDAIWTERRASSYLLRLSVKLRRRAQGKSQAKPGQGRPSYIVLVVLAGTSPCLGLPVASGSWVPSGASQCQSVSASKAARVA